MYQIAFVNTAGAELIERVVFQTKEMAVKFAESCGWFYKDEFGKLWQMVLRIVE